jgi:small subunit ribosomal protein S20
MPHSPSAAKRLRQSKRAHRRRKVIVSEIKNLVKKFYRNLSSKNIKEARQLLKKIVSKLSKAAAKNVVHKNTAARKISRLARRLNSTK